MRKKSAVKNNHNIILSTIGHFTVDLYPAFIIGILPMVAIKFNLSIFQVSILTAISQISNSITQPFFGYLSDKYGIRKYMIYGLLCASVFLSLIAIAPNYLLILIFLFLGNLGVSAYHPPSASIGAEYKGNKKGFGNSIIAFGGNAGYAVGALFFVSLIEKFGVNFSLLAIIPGIIVTLLLYKAIPSQNFNYSTKIQVKGTRKIKIKKTKILSIFLIWFTAFARDILWVSLLTFMPLHFADQKINLINTSIILLGFGLIGGVGGIFSTYFADRIKRNILIQIAYIIVIPLIFFIFKLNQAGSIILFISTGFFLISTVPICISLSHELLPKNLGLASSLVIGFSSGFAGIVNMFMGKLADNIGITNTIYILLIFPFLSFISMFFLPKLERKLK